MRIALAMLLACVLAACATLDSTVKRFPGLPTFQASDAKQVQILHDEPQRPHHRLGEVYVNVPFEQTSDEEIEARLRFDAAALGGDAVVVVADKEISLGLGPTRRVVGLVIRYR